MPQRKPSNAVATATNFAKPGGARVNSLQLLSAWHLASEETYGRNLERKRLSSPVAGIGSASECFEFYVCPTRQPAEVIALPVFPLPRGGFPAVAKRLCLLRRGRKSSTVRAGLEPKRHRRPLVRLGAAAAIEDGCRGLEVLRAEASPYARPVSLKEAAAAAYLVNGLNAPALTGSKG